MPGASEVLNRPVFCLQPGAKLGLRRRTIALLNSALVPEIIPQRGRLIAITLHQGREELLRLAPNILVVQTQGRTAGRATAADGGIALTAAAIDVACTG